MIPRRRPFKAPGLILALGCLVPAVWAGEGSIVRIGPCVNPDCNVTPPNSGFKGVATGNYHTMGLRSNGSVAAWGMCDVGQCTLPIPNTGFEVGRGFPGLRRGDLLGAVHCLTNGSPPALDRARTSARAPDGCRCSSR